MLNHNVNGATLNEDECGCQTQGCPDCAADSASRSEAAAIDGETSATTVACTPWLPSTLAVAHLEIVALDNTVITLRKALGDRDAVIGRKVGYMAQLELAHADDHKRIENLTLTIRELEALILRRDQEIAEKRAAIIYESNVKLDTLARANSLQMSIYELEDRIAGFERDMEGTLKELEIARMDAEKHLNIGAELSDLLNDSGKREDRAHETLMGIRALAESQSLTDNEKVALILRLA